MKVKFKYIIVLAFFMSAACYTSAQAVFNMKKDSAESLKDAFFVLEESSDFKEDIEKVRKQHFVPLKEQEFKKHNAYWAKVKIVSGYDIPVSKLLFIGGKRSSDSALMYLYEDGELLKTEKSGYFVNANDKVVKYEHGSKFRLYLEAGKTYTLFFRIKNISGFTPAFIPELVDEDKFNDKLHLRNLVQGIHQGVFWIMFLYYLFTYFYNRKKSFLFYALYALGIGMNIAAERGLLIDFVIPNAPTLNPYIFIFFTGLAAVSYFQFIRYFIETKTKFPKWDKLLNILLWTNAGVTLYLLGHLLFTFNIAFSLNISNIMNLVGLIAGLVFLVFLLKHGDKVARYFVVATFFMAAGTITTLSILMGGFDVGIQPGYFMHAGTVLQILVFSLGLGYKMRQTEIEKQHVQKKLIEQLKTNDELQIKVNRELEEKVKARTLKLEKNAKELGEKNEEINQQREEVLATAENLERANRRVIEKSRALEFANKEMSDSINYASTIQQATLPDKKIVESFFDEHFIFYKPREVVSGDFYWMRDFGRYFVVATADCTGHGVPGAFMSLLGTAFLNEIVMRRNAKMPGQILNELRLLVKQSLKQTGQSEKKDGMDLALYSIDKQNGQLYFAGAYNPLVLIREQEKGELQFVSEKGRVKTMTENGFNLYQINGDRQPVGSAPSEKPFNTRVMQLKSGDRLYTYSDGYADQMGGKRARKYMSKNFRSLLLKNCALPFSEQAKKLDTVLKEWQGDIRQVDDILIVGVKTGELKKRK